MIRKAVAVGASVIAVFVASAAATAAGPEISTSSFRDHYIDTETCPGMALDTQLDAHITVQEFSETRAQVKQRFVYTVTANGKTFTDNENFMEFANPEAGVSTFVGTVINIQIPGYGNLLRDTGRLTIDFSTTPWTVMFEAGHHPFFHDGFGVLCDYLAS